MVVMVVPSWVPRYVMQDGWLGRWGSGLPSDRRAYCNYLILLRLYGCFLKWCYPQNTPKWSFLLGKPRVVGYHHFRTTPYIVLIYGSSFVDKHGEYWGFWYLSIHNVPGGHVRAQSEYTACCREKQNEWDMMRYETGWMPERMKVPSYNVLFKMIHAQIWHTYLTFLYLYTILAMYCITMMIPHFIFEDIDTWHDIVNSGKGINKNK